MQNAHVYFRGVAANSWRFIGTEGVSRGRVGIQTFTENVLWRGKFSVIDSAFPHGKKHPDGQFPNFYVGDISDCRRLPGWGEEVWKGRITFRGIYNPAKQLVSEEIGWYINGKYFPKDQFGNVTMIGIPGRPSAVTNIQINQPTKSYSRRYVSLTAPADPTIDSSGVMSKPANFVPPSVPVALTWLVDANAVYNYPNGWYLVNGSVIQDRLSDGTLLPLYEISEQWLYTPPKSTL